MYVIYSQQEQGEREQCNLFSFRHIYHGFAIKLRRAGPSLIHSEGQLAPQGRKKLTRKSGGRTTTQQTNYDTEMWEEERQLA